MANQPISKELKTTGSVILRIWKVQIFVTIVYMLINPQNIAEATSTTEASATTSLKYILLWTDSRTSPVSSWLSGQQKFITQKCPVSNCYITDRRDFFGSNVTKFDAVIFNGRNLKATRPSTLPRKRSPHQKYIFLNMESSDNQPICTAMFDGFFNWTATYKLNSDIVTNYLEVMNAAGEVVGPRANMSWIAGMSDVNDTLLHTFERKTKAAAWFVSHCNTLNKREKYAESLKKALRTHNLTLDIYGRCGDLKCPRKDAEICNNMLRDDYFFYLSFENSFAEDYITEKALTPLFNGAVPILYGGSNYSRFLPPGSYMDACLYNPEDLASLMAVIIRNPALYREFFRWRNHYRYRYPSNACRLCAALHDKTKFEAHSVYQDFRAWWNPNHQNRCLNKNWAS